MKPDPLVMLLSYHAALELRDLEAVSRMLAPDAAYQSNGLGMLTGRDNILLALRDYFHRHPDHSAHDTHIEQLDTHHARAYWTLQATDTSTGRTISRSGTEVITIDQANRIARIEVTDE